MDYEESLRLVGVEGSRRVTMMFVDEDVAWGGDNSGDGAAWSLWTELTCFRRDSRRVKDLS